MANVYEKAANALAGMHSHEICLEPKIAELCAEVGLTFAKNASGSTYVLKSDVTDRKSHVTTQTYRQIVRAVAQSKAGGYVQNAGEGVRYVTAEMLSMGLTYLLLGTDPGAQKFGRGSAYRERVDALLAKSRESVSAGET